MTKRVLDVGQCDYDHAKIRAFLEANFAVAIDRAEVPEEALAALRKRQYDLVLVNRKLDSDYSDGVEIIRQMKADAALAAVPVMLVTNYKDHQAAAVALGAFEGFGKLEYAKPETKEKLVPFLG